MFIEGEFSSVEASTSWGSCATDRPGVVDRIFLGEIHVGSPDSDTVPPSSGTIPSWRYCGYHLSTSLSVPGETLGPSGLGSSVVASFFKVLFGS
jgi:hypothetical protein